MNYLDLLIVLVLLVAFYTGYRNGLIKTIFRTIGYIAGGVVGLALAVKYFATWESQTQKVVLALLAVFIGASLGEFLLGKVRGGHFYISRILHLVFSCNTIDLFNLEYCR
jgi:uncharacterized membrane protein required for colicin V production